MKEGKGTYVLRRPPSRDTCMSINPPPPLPLQALHERGEANADHTTLLLNCYTKLKDIDQLDKFVAVSVSVSV